MDLTFRPIQQWPQPLTKSRKSGQFRAVLPGDVAVIGPRTCPSAGKANSDPTGAFGRRQCTWRNTDAK